MRRVAGWPPDIHLGVARSLDSLDTLGLYDLDAPASFASGGSQR
jgi:hypothetical protein